MNPSQLRLMGMELVKLESIKINEMNQSCSMR